MGRKPKNNAIVLSLAVESPSQERVEQASNGNIKPTTVLDSQPEVPQPKCSPLKHPNLSVDGMGPSLKTNTPQVQMNPEIKHKDRYNTFKRKHSKSPSTSVRRSCRIKSGVVHSPTTNQGIEKTGIINIEDLIVSESDKDEPTTQIEPVLQEPQPELQPQLELEQESADNLSGKSLDEKVDYALQRIEALDKIIELIKSKVDGNAGFYETPTMSSISYRSMYIDSQKKLGILTNENQQLAADLANALAKIEMLGDLTNQNQQLTAELAIALAKIEMYEKQNRILSEPFDKLKDTANAAVSVLSNLAKTAEAVVVGASTHAINNTCSASASKRMRIEN